MKRLVVNADDLGYDPEIDRGILEAHASGIVTSATAMVETPFSAAALRAAPDTLGVGLHAVLDPRSATGEAGAALRRQLERIRPSAANQTAKATRPTAVTAGMMKGRAFCGARAPSFAFRLPAFGKTAADCGDDASSF